MSLFSEIDHVGIVVRDLDAAVAFYVDTFGCPPGERHTAEVYGADVVFLKVAESFVQLLTPTSPDSQLHDFLREHGEGLHHIAFRVENCKLALEGVKLSGHRVLDEEPWPGPRDSSIARIEPSGAFGTLIELVQVPN